MAAAQPPQQLVQRRAPAGGRAGGADADDWRLDPSGPGLKAWHLWMMFGLGWPAILLFGLSTIPFRPGVQWWLIVWGWVFNLSWVAGAVGGLGLVRPSKAQTSAFHATLAVAVGGSAVGGVRLATYAYRHAPQLYVYALVLVLVGAYALNSQQPGGSAGDDGDANAAGAAPAAAGPAAAATAGGGGGDAGAAGGGAGAGALPPHLLD